MVWIVWGSGQHLQIMIFILFILFWRFLYFLYTFFILFILSWRFWTHLLQELQQCKSAVQSRSLIHQSLGCEICCQSVWTLLDIKDTHVDTDVDVEVVRHFEIRNTLKSVAHGNPMPCICIYHVYHVFCGKR